MIHKTSYIIHFFIFWFFLMSFFTSSLIHITFSHHILFFASLDYDSFQTFFVFMTFTAGDILLMYSIECLSTGVCLMFFSRAYWDHGLWEYRLQR